jgi:exodeoxyribonuclease VII small subunit
MSKAIQFEKSMAELAAIIKQLEQGELTLEEGLKHYEQGVHIARKCQIALTQAEQKIETLKLQSLDPRNLDEDNSQP